MSALSFAIGLVFLVLLRFLIAFCVWIAVLGTVVMFALGGAFIFVLSGQCSGASFWDTGHQNAVAIVVAGSGASFWDTGHQNAVATVIAGTTAASNLVQGTDAVSEDMIGNGAEYRGVQHYTKFGRFCRVWDEQQVMPDDNSTLYPDADLLHYYCRNPYHPGDAYKAKTISCITTDPDISWEEGTPIGVIQPECTHGYVI